MSAKNAFSTRHQTRTNVRVRPKEGGEPRGGHGWETILLFSVIFRCIILLLALSARDEIADTREVALEN